ncbi:MAG: hypothetical protein GX256_07960 [Fretibacterium sp.]|nr:hypothetical protein [Fretibacterium sp.]
MKNLRALIILLTFLTTFLLPSPASAQNSAEAFMSATFGLSSKRTQLRMERSGAEASDFIRDGRLSMKGLFEGRPALFIFGFHPKKGLNYKAVYLTSTGNSQKDYEFYENLRLAYTLRFGTVKERPLPNMRVEGKLMYRSVWTPNKYTTIALSYDPKATNRFPGESPGARPIHLIYSYSKWDKK